MNTVNQNAADQLVAMARETLVNTPEYVEHIGNTLASCVQCLRAGDDSVGMGAFARGVADLEQFILLFEQVTAIAKPRPDGEVDAFRDQLHDCVRELEVAVNSRDFVGLSDSLDSRLLPLLPSWAGVARELEAGLGN